MRRHREVHCLDRLVHRGSRASPGRQVQWDQPGPWDLQENRVLQGRKDLPDVTVPQDQPVLRGSRA
ncbi:hypothetical protein GCM10007389_37860 [Pontibacter akesuensis]|nr:hypothetical protein GCM10007389_37860 [Pontibacter akesuensis]